MPQIHAAIYPRLSLAVIVSVQPVNRYRTNGDFHRRLPLPFSVSRRAAGAAGGRDRRGRGSGVVRPASSRRGGRRCGRSGSRVRRPGRGWRGFGRWWSRNVSRNCRRAPVGCAMGPEPVKSARTRGLPILVLFFRNRSHRSSHAASSQARRLDPRQRIGRIDPQISSHGISPGPSPSSGGDTPLGYQRPSSAERSSGRQAGKTALPAEVVEVVEVGDTGPRAETRNLCEPAIFFA